MSLRWLGSSQPDAFGESFVSSLSQASKRLGWDIGHRQKALSVMRAPYEVLPPRLPHGVEPPLKVAALVELPDGMRYLPFHLRVVPLPRFAMARAFNFRAARPQ